jgi:hypothetical protein
MLGRVLWAYVDSIGSARLCGVATEGPLATSEPPRGEHGTYDSMKDLMAAVHVRSAGKSLDEIEQILREEMSARGVLVPERAIPRTVSMIRGFADVEADVVAQPRGLIGQLRGLRLLLRVIGAAASDSEH